MDPSGQPLRELLWSFHIFYRGRRCLFSAGDYRPGDEDLLYGLLVTLKSFSEQVGGARSNKPAGRKPGQPAPNGFQTFNSFTTSRYKLHCLEIPTGYWFVCTTPASPLIDMRDYLRQLYQELFVPLVIRNPGWDVVGGAGGGGGGGQAQRISTTGRFAKEVNNVFRRLNGQNPATAVAEAGANSRTRRCWKWGEGSGFERRWSANNTCEECRA